MSKLSHLTDQILASGRALLPSQCLACRAPIQWRDGSAQPSRRSQWDLCPQCWSDLPWCSVDPTLPGLDETRSALGYEGAVRDWVASLKRRNDPRAQRVLARLMLETLSATAELTSELAPQALVPVPMTRWRWLLRGHNPAHSLCVPLRQVLRIPIADRLVVLPRKGKSQHQRSRQERLTALNGAFRVQGAVPARIAIVDDVVTTGGTARALAEALRCAGAQRVVLWTAAYTLPLKAEAC